MTRLLFLGLNLIFLIPNSFAAVTIIGKEDAALCYQSAELGYTGYSQTQACLRALDDPFLNNRDRSGTQINLGIIFNNLFLPDKAVASFNKAKFFIDFKPEIFLNSGNSYFIKIEFWKAI